MHWRHNHIERVYNDPLRCQWGTKIHPQSSSPISQDSWVTWGKWYFFLICCGPWRAVFRRADTSFFTPAAGEAACVFEVRRLVILHFSLRSHVFLAPSVFQLAEADNRHLTATPLLGAHLSASLADLRGVRLRIFLFHLTRVRSSLNSGNITFSVFPVPWTFTGY